METMIWIIIIIFMLWLFRVIQIRSIRNKKLRQSIEQQIRELHDVTEEFKRTMADIRSLDENKVDR